MPKQKSEGEGQSCVYRRGVTPVQRFMRPFVFVALLLAGHAQACERVCSSETLLVGSDGGRGSRSTMLYTDSQGNKVTSTKNSYPDGWHHYLSYAFGIQTSYADWICHVGANTACPLTVEFAEDVVVTEVKFDPTQTGYDGGRTTATFEVNGEMQNCGNALEIRASKGTVAQKFTNGREATNKLIMGMTGGTYGPSVKRCASTPPPCHPVARRAQCSAGARGAAVSRFLFLRASSD